MITVSVRYYNVLRQVTGLERETVVIPEGSLPALLRHLAKAHGPALETMLFGQENAISDHLVIFCNQQLVPPGQRGKPLADGDELMLFPAMSGG